MAYIRKVAHNRIRLLIILPYALVACLQRDTTYNGVNPLEKYWISKTLDDYPVDSALGGGQTIYGSGHLIVLDSNSQSMSLGADFYWENDSLYHGGEPGMTLKMGRWQLNDGFVTLYQKLVLKTFMLSGEVIGQSEVDTITLKGNGQLIYKYDTLIPLLKQSNELELLLNKLKTVQMIEKQ